MNLANTVQYLCTRKIGRISMMYVLVSRTFRLPTYVFCFEIKNASSDLKLFITVVKTVEEYTIICNGCIYFNVTSEEKKLRLAKIIIIL